MINDLKVFQWGPSETVPETPHGQFFRLKTCQRVICVGFRHLPHSDFPDPSNVFSGAQGYRHLLEIICGLQSKLLGENEILGQFKKAYQEFITAEIAPNALILKLLEKLLVDAKKIRRDHLSHLGIQTYAGIARQMVKAINPQAPILVIGSGQLAESFIRIADSGRVTVAARNSERVQQLCQDFGIQAKPYQELDGLLDFPIIYNTLSKKSDIWSSSFLRQWLSKHSTDRLLIDLAKPSMLPSDLEKTDGLVTLEKIFAWGEQLGLKKSEQIENAKNEIRKCVQNRTQNFTGTFPFGWEELSFA